MNDEDCIQISTQNGLDGVFNRCAGLCQASVKLAIMETS